MTTTCADILTRALALSVANQGLVDANVSGDVVDVLSRINQMQQRAVTRFTQRNKTLFLMTTTTVSTGGASARTADLSALTSRVQRIIRVTLPSGIEVALVDPNVPTSEMAPRYYTQGETLVEVSNDWDTTSAGAVTLTIQYSARPNDLDVSVLGALTQAVTIPDRFTDLLVYDLGAFLAEKDVGREDAEVADLTSKRDGVIDAWVESAAQFGGVPVYAFEIPVPQATSKD